jgi:diguanylate cyclase (GGDEF)-like protein
MFNPSPFAGSKPGTHWMVQTNFRLRAGSFALLFVSVALDWYVKGATATMWVLLALQFLVYPQLMHWRARLSKVQHETEMNNLLIDSFLVGVWVALLQFALWPSFALWVGSTLNITVVRGWKGLRNGTCMFVAGILLSVLLFGWRFAPDTGLPTTLLLMFGLAFYLLALANASNNRNVKLRQTREQLRLGEQAMQASNAILEQRLAEIQILQDRLKEQALRDPMTGLFNRRYLDTIVPHELARCSREKLPLCVMMIDLDHFKTVNDTYGHQGGDEVLKALAELLLASVRASDVACRYGGEEFLLLLPNMSADNAVTRAEHWRAAFAATTVNFGGAAIQATLSIGIALYPEEGGTADELTRCADLALYEAKKRGRNRVVLFRAPNAIQNLPVPQQNCVI